VLRVAVKQTADQLALRRQAAPVLPEGTQETGVTA
jgi:hypothetical protein